MSDILQDTHNRHISVCHLVSSLNWFGRQEGKGYENHLPALWLIVMLRATANGR